MTGADRSLRASFRAVAIAGALLSVAVSLHAGPGAGVSAALGALFGLLNLYAYARIVGAVAVAPVEPGRAGNAGFVFGVLALGKILVLFGGIWLVLTRGLADAIPLVIGYGAMPIGIAIGAVVSDKTT